MITPGRVTKLPCHYPPTVNFVNNQPRRMEAGLSDSFTYIAPVVKYSPAAFQPGPVYRGGEAAAIGHQPYNWTDQWTAYQTPHYWSMNNMQVYRGSQSSASFSVAQNAMAMLLNRSSSNG